MAEKGSTSCASVGCTLLQASMSHSKGGSENVCVNYDTSTALALASLDVTLQRCTRAYILTFLYVVSYFEVRILTDLNVHVLTVIL